MKRTIFFLSQKIKKTFINLPIYRKLLFIMGLLTLLILCSSVTAIELTSRSHQKLLYSSVSSLMGTSSTEISDQITNTINLSSSMLSNQELQNILGELKDSYTNSKLLSPYTNLYQDLSTLVYEYYYTYPSHNISYIAVTNGTFTLSTYNKGNRLSADIIQDISVKAEKAHGAPVLITEYADKYGIFLSRTVRRIDSLKLDSLGTIIINIDIRSLLKDATDNITFSEEVFFTLSEENRSVPFYTSTNLTSEKFVFPKMQNYTICKIGEKNYFAVTGNIPACHWNYICFVEYDSVLLSLLKTKFAYISMNLLCALIIFAIARKMIRSLTVHLHLLAKKMVAFGKDNSALLPSPYDYSGRKDEIGTLHNQFDDMAQKIRTLIEENYKSELLRKDMLLKNLQSQINPHFLYNTLESINWRAKASGEKDISSMVESLGALLRTSLTPHPDISTLADEMRIVHNYITIQEIRFDGRLQYIENISPAVTNCGIPLLTIQPLVENAVRYGLESIIDSCSIKINAFAENNMLIIQIINNGSQFEENTLEKLLTNQIVPHGFGIGILNIQKRIHMIYGEAYGIQLKNIDEDHALSEIILPLNTFSERKEPFYD